MKRGYCGDSTITYYGDSELNLKLISKGGPPALPGWQ